MAPPLPPTVRTFADGPRGGAPLARPANGHGPGSLAAYANQLAGAPAPMRLDKQALKDWMVRQLLPPPRGSGKKQIVSFTLQHDDDKRQDRVVITEEEFPKTHAEAEREEALDRAVAEFARASEASAAVFPVVQRFYACSHWTLDRAEKADKEWPFLVSPPPDVAAAFHQRQEGEASMGPVVGHLQRLLDRSFGLVVSNNQSQLDRLTTLCETLLERYDVLFGQRWEMAVKCEKLLDEHAVREITVAEAQVNLQVKQELLAGLMKYGGAFAAKLLAPQSAGTDAAVEGLKALDAGELFMLIKVVDNLDAEKRDKFAPLFRAVLNDLPADKAKCFKELIDGEMASRGAQNGNGDGK